MLALARRSCSGRGSLLPGLAVARAPFSRPCLVSGAVSGSSASEREEGLTVLVSSRTAHLALQAADALLCWRLPRRALLVERLAQCLRLRPPQLPLLLAGFTSAEHTSLEPASAPAAGRSTPGTVTVVLFPSAPPSSGSSAACQARAGRSNLPGARARLVSRLPRPRARPRLR